PAVPGAGAPAAGPAGEATGAGGLVDVNTADAAALEALPGIGPATAQAIIDHRERHGPFRSVDDLLDVRGIGEAKLAQIRDLVTV
ncbi:MAG: ComEA family DNA-binding protein, partial [Acidimicrobiia bacterium]